MVNFKQTVINLHKSFPEMDLDMLFKIMECIVEDASIFPNIPAFPNTNPTAPNTPQYWTSLNIKYSDKTDIGGIRK